MSKTQEIRKPIDAFFDEEYLSYAKYVVENRAIPSVIDGFKPTQRKVIHASNKVWKSGNEKPLKVFQLAGTVAATTFYHHGNCVDENTRVHLEDGSSISLKEWTLNFPEKSMKILSWDEMTQEFVYELSTPPFTGQSIPEEVEIELENGDVIRCTPDHLVLLTDGSWIEAQHLSVLHEIKSY